MVGFLMLSLGTVASAQTTTTSTTVQTRTAGELRTQERQTINTDRTALKQEIQAKRDAFKKDLRDQRDSFMKEVKILKAEFQKNNAQKKEEFRGRAQEMLSKEFDMAVRNLEALQARVASRISKEKLAGKDTTIEETALANSKIQLDAAKIKIAEVKALIPIDGAKITDDIFEKIKLGARDAKDLLKQVHQELIHAVTGLKEQEGKNDQQDQQKVGAPVQTQGQN